MNSLYRQLKVPCANDYQVLGDCRVFGSRFGLWVGWLLLSLVASMGSATATRAQDAKVWEYSPYEVDVWYSFGGNLGLPEAAKETFLSQLKHDLSRTFRATWRTRMAALAPEWSSIVEDRFDRFELRDLTENELVLAVSLKNENTKTVRTLEAAVEKLDSVAITDAGMLQMQQAAQRFAVEAESLSAKLIELCRIQPDSGERILEQLQAGELACALLPRSSLDGAEGIRVLVTDLPWQTDRILSEKDKVFFLSITMDGDEFRVRVRELDCPMRYLGPAFDATTLNWEYAPRVASATFVNAFAPTARVEEAETTYAILRHRAGKLIVREDNPSRIRVGDVMQPIVRRDDRNGVPTLLQPLPWTFAAITKSDGVRMQANVYTYSNGPGLKGRKNRRTRRVLLRVRPLVPDTDVKVVVRGTNEPQAGCFVYERHHLTGEFEMLGRTDWRGQFNVEVPENPRVLPDEIRRQRRQAERDAAANTVQPPPDATQSQVGRPQPEEGDATVAGESDQAAEEDGSQAEDVAEADPNSDSGAGETAAEVDTFESKASTAEDVPYDPETDPDAIRLNHPLVLLYLKNGDNVLAMLPMVPGLQDMELAELTDDRRRLETEAFVKGFQGEILDIIGLRNLLAARIRILVKEGEAEEAEKTLDQMRDLPSFSQMADELDAIQRQMLDESRGAISLGSKSRIDRMFQTTRDLLQKYLQDKLLEESTEAVRRVGSAEPATSTETVE